MTMKLMTFVIPAHAGIHAALNAWTPAFAGVTGRKVAQ
jgi:hypothetical protein